MTSPEIDNQILGDLTWKGYKDITIGGFERGVAIERERIINLLTDLNVIRRDVFDHLVAFNTDGTEVVYLTGLEEGK